MSACKVHPSAPLNFETVFIRGFAVLSTEIAHHFPRKGDRSILLDPVPCLGGDEKSSNEAGGIQWPSAHTR